MEFFFSPFVLLFLSIVLGLAIGKIRFGGISLGISGILFVAILAGFLTGIWMPQTNAEEISAIRDTMKVFSKLGTSLFVSVIGLQTGFSVKKGARRAIPAFGIGAFMSLSGVTGMLLLSALDPSVSRSAFLGILCGALTSTPGLSSTCELLKEGTEEAVLGYGSAYLPGVLCVVFFAQLNSRHTVKDNSAEVLPDKVKSDFFLEMSMIGTVALLGTLLEGRMKALFGISFGSTASILTVGLLFGCFGKNSVGGTAFPAFSPLRNLGLALFFVGTGVTTGTQMGAFHPKEVFYGTLISLSAIFCGWLLCKLSPHRENLQTGLILAGGLTSSPAYSAVTAETGENGNDFFSFSYFGALIALIAALQIICR